MNGLLGLLLAGILGRSHLVSPVPEDFQGGVNFNPTSETRPTPSTQDFQSGFAKFGRGNPPIASLSGELAQGASRLPSKIDPYVGAVLSLMETGGGARQAYPNNPLNVGGTAYASPKVALLGGGPDNSKGFYNLIANDPRYSAFRQSGNLEDLFNVFTPPGPEHGNPSLPDLLGRYKSVRSLFPE